MNNQSKIAANLAQQPPFHEPVEENLAAAKRLDELIANGDPEKALITFRTEVVRQSPEDVARMKERPSWQSLIATVSLQPRQMRALAAYRFDAKRMKAVSVPTLLLLGETTASPYLKRSIRELQGTLPNATLVTLERQGHNAMESGRELLAKAIIEFIDIGRKKAAGGESTRAFIVIDGFSVAN